jgi:hypothetical protein
MEERAVPLDSNIRCGLTVFTGNKPRRIHSQGFEFHGAQTMEAGKNKEKVPYLLYSYIICIIKIQNPAVQQQ